MFFLVTPLSLQTSGTKFPALAGTNTMRDNITYYPSLRPHTPYHYFRKSELEKISKNRIYVKSIAFVSSGTTRLTLFMAEVIMNKGVFSQLNYFFLQKMCYYRLLFGFHSSTSSEKLTG